MNIEALLLSKKKKLGMKLFLVAACNKAKKKEFTLENLSEQQCLKLFRFSKEQLVSMRKLLRIPWKVVCRNKTTCSGLEALCILLRRLAYPNRLTDLTFLFPRKEPEIGEIFNFTLSHVYDNFNHLLDDLNQPWLSNECLELYAEAIRRKGCPLQKCWGFVDGTVRAICRPGKYQKECYNGHKRVHALKYQSIVIPSGIIANLFGPIEGRRHDSFMLSESKILQDLEQKNLNEPEPFCIYGDPAYPLRAELQAPFKGSRLTPQQAAFNKKMSMSRISVEWAFEKVISLFAFVDFKKNQRLYLQPVGKYFKVAVILTNIHTCFNGSQVSSFFETEPLSVAECLTPRNQNE